VGELPFDVGERPFDAGGFPFDAGELPKAGGRLHKKKFILKNLNNRRLKHFSIYALSLVAGLAMTVGCGNDDPKEPKEPARLKVIPTTISVDANGGSPTITVDANVVWKAESDQTWVTISGETNTSFLANVAASTVSKARTATITVTGSGQSATVAVTQTAGTIVLSVMPSTANVSTAGGELEFTVTSNADWTLVSDAAWAVVSPASGTDTGKITVTVEANTGAVRMATITLTAGEKTIKATVKQAAKEGLDVTLDVTPDAADIAAAGGTAEFTVTSNADWTASSSETWAVVSPIKQGSTGLTVTAAANTGDERTVTITVKAGDITKTVTVKQVVAFPITVILSEAVPSVQKKGKIAADVAPSFKVTVPADGTLIVSGTHDWGVRIIAPDNSVVYENWWSWFPYNYPESALTVIAGDYLFVYDNADGETDYNFTFSFEPALVGVAKLNTAEFSGLTAT
jgi:hypothetical protein